MNKCISTKTIQEVENFQEKMEKIYYPSTFKFIEPGNFIEGILFIFKPLKKEEKHGIDLYLRENDDVIDDESIENDMAVVAKDLLTSFKKYDNKC